MAIGLTALSVKSGFSSARSISRRPAGLQPAVNGQAVTRNDLYYLDGVAVDQNGDAYVVR